MEDRSFVDEQRDYWRHADVDHYRWQTGDGYIAATEAELVSTVDVSPGDRLLEIGCGEGSNLHHLAHRGARLFGVDFTPAKAHHAALATGAVTACADAEHLPFADASFQAVLIRDLLHHVCDRVAVLDEAHRVLAPGGRITLIEPNGKSPLIAAQARAIAAERGMLASTAPRLVGELKRAGFTSIHLDRAQPLPLSRALLHYKLGAPSLATLAPVRWALTGLERALSLLPHSLWAYLIARGTKT